MAFWHKLVVFALLFLLVWFWFMCRSVSECMYVAIHTFLQRSEGGAGSLETSSRWLWTAHWVLGIKWRSSPCKSSRYFYMWPYFCLKKVVLKALNGKNVLFPHRMVPQRATISVLLAYPPITYPVSLGCRASFKKYPRAWDPLLFWLRLRPNCRQLSHPEGSEMSHVSCRLGKERTRASCSWQLFGWFRCEVHLQLLKE